VKRLRSLVQRRSPAAAPASAIGAALLVAAGLAGCGGSPHETTAAATTPVAVRTLTLAAREIAEPLEAGGVVTARQTATVASRVLAPVATVRVTAGDRVKAGDVLVTLDARDATARSRESAAAAGAAEQSLTQARSARAAAEAELRLATSWHQRIAALHDRRSATDQELDEAKARLDAATAHLAGAQAAIEQATAASSAARAGAEAAQTTESFTTVRAPFAGLVTERLIDPGTLATPGTPLLRLESSGPPRVEVPVDEARVPYIRPGQTVDVVVPQAADTSATVPGTVVEVARAVSAGQRAFTVKVDLPAATAAIRSGTFARVRFPGPTRTTLTVPDTAIRRYGQATSVLVERDNIARMVPVRTGVVVGQDVEVVAGLVAGDRVIVEPPVTLGDGDPVTPQPAAVQESRR
jgi:HlyD family secretion protein